MSALLIPPGVGAPRADEPRAKAPADVKSPHAHPTAHARSAPGHARATRFEEALAREDEDAPPKDRESDRVDGGDATPAAPAEKPRDPVALALPLLMDRPDAVAVAVTVAAATPGDTTPAIGAADVVASLALPNAAAAPVLALGDALGDARSVVASPASPVAVGARAAVSVTRSPAPAASSAAVAPANAPAVAAAPSAPSAPPAERAAATPREPSSSTPRPPAAVSASAAHAPARSAAAPAAPRVDVAAVPRAPIVASGPAPGPAAPVVNTVNTVNVDRRTGDAARAPARIDARGGAGITAPTPAGEAGVGADASTSGGGSNGSGSGEHAESAASSPEKAEKATTTLAHGAVDVSAQAPVTADRARAGAAPPGDRDARGDADRPELSPRQEAVTLAVNRMALRQGAHAEVDVPELGRLTVDARSRGKDVDVSVSVDRAHSAAALRVASPELAAYLRDANVPLAKLSVESSVSGGAGGRDDGERSGQPRADDQGRGDPRGTTDPGQRGDPRRRVRFVL